MKPFIFAVSLFALSASGGAAEDVPTAPSPTPVNPPTTAGPSMMSGPSLMAAPVTEYAPAPMAQPARRGLFGRLRNRNTMTYSGTSMPMMTAPTTPPMMSTPTPTPMPPVAPTPMPGPQSSGMMMPGTAVPAGGSMVVPAGGGMIVPATGNVPPGIYTTTDGMVVQVGGTQMSTVMSSPMTTSTPRRGLFSRLRNR